LSREIFIVTKLASIPILAVVFAIGTASATYATPINVDQWYHFTFGPQNVSPGFSNGNNAAAGVNPVSIAAPDPDWTFTLPINGTLTVVDGAASGDQFNVTDFGVSLGDTSVPTSGSNCGNDITACLSDSDISKGMFAITAGPHAINGTVIQSAVQGLPGGAFFDVSEVPAPAALPLFASGLGALGLLGWRRKRRAQAIA